METLGIKSRELIFLQHHSHSVGFRIRDYSIIMNAYHLRKSEIQYELKIRNLSPDGTAGDLRKRLSQAFAENVEPDLKFINDLDVSSELEECEMKVQDLSTMVSDYEGTFQDNEYHRIVARLLHLSRRVEIIPENARVEEDLELKNSLLTRAKELLESFKQNSISKSRSTQSEASKDTTQGNVQSLVRMFTQPEPNASNQERTDDDISESNRLQSNPTQVNNSESSKESGSNVPVAQVNPQRPRYVPVYKWGLTFDNNGQSIAAFLERVEELRRARGVTHQELFESAVDLFSGAALVWYRASSGRLHSWHQLCNELKEVFQPPDYDFRLQQEIFNRFQGDKEPIDLYVAAMEGLYGRLSGDIPESSRLAQIFNNLHPQLQDRLALVDIKTLNDLRTMGRRVEAGRLRHARPRPSTTQVSALEPDLAYHDSLQRRGPPTASQGRVAAVNEDHMQRRFTRTCWNCGREGHRFVNCRNPRKRFCYGCGKENFLKKDCPTCNPSKNVPSRDSAKET